MGTCKDTQLLGARQQNGPSSLTGIHRKGETSTGMNKRRTLCTHMSNHPIRVWHRTGHPHEYGVPVGSGMMVNGERACSVQCITHIEDVACQRVRCGSATRVAV